MDRPGAAGESRQVAARPERVDLLWTVALFLLGLVLRLAHLWTVRDSPFFEHLMLDPRMYDEWGQRIAAGDWWGDRPFFQDPLYAYFLGLIYAVVGHRLAVVVAVQGLLGSLVAPLLYNAARVRLGRAPAAAGGLIAALYLPSLYYEGMILKTWMTVLLVACVLWLLSRARTDGPRWNWPATGLVLGLGCLSRGNLVLFVPVLALWVFLLAPGRTETAGAMGTRPNLGFVGRRLAAGAGSAALLFLAGVTVVLFPTALRNRVVGGEWILATSNAGQNFYIGNNPANTTGEYTPLPFVDPNPKHEERGFALEAERRAGRKLSSAEASRFWFREGLGWVRAERGAWARLVWRKLRNYWGAYEIPDNLDYYLYRESAPLLRLPLPGFGLIAPLGLLGAVLSWRRGAWPRLLTVFVLVYSVSVVLFFVFSRFRMAMMPALFVLAGLGAVELGRRCREAARARRLPRGLAGAVALLLALLAFVHLPVRAREEGLTYRAARWVGLPVRGETSATAHFNLGLVYAAAARGSAEEEELLRLAEAELRVAVRDGPRLAKLHVELGKVLARQDRNGEAIGAYLRAAEIESRDYRTHHALGLLHRREGDPAAAAARFRQSLSLAPRHTASATRLGEVLLEMGQPEEAARAFRHALSLSPGNESARRGLERTGLSAP